MTSTMSRRGMLFSVAGAAALAVAGSQHEQQHRQREHSQQDLARPAPDSRPGQLRGAGGGKEGRQPRQGARRGRRQVVWTGTVGPFAPAVLEMAAGELDIAQGSITSAVTALSATPVFDLFAQQHPDRIGEGILVPANSPIRTVQDLIGKSVAVNKGGTGEYLLRKALAWAGIPVSKVTLVYLEPGGDRAGAQLGQGRRLGDLELLLGGRGRPGERAVRRHRRADRLGELLDLGGAEQVRHPVPQVVAAFYQYLHDEGLKLVADPSAFVNVFTNAGPEALSPAEITFSDKDSAALGTIEPDHAGHATQFQTVASFFASEGVTKDSVRRRAATSSSRAARDDGAGRGGLGRLPGAGNAAAAAWSRRGGRRRLGDPAVPAPLALIGVWWIASATGVLNPAVLSSPARSRRRRLAAVASGQLSSPRSESPWAGRCSGSRSGCPPG